MKAFLAVAIFGLSSVILAPVSGVAETAQAVALFILGGLFCLGAFMFSDRSADSGFDWSDLECELKASEQADAQAFALAVASDLDAIALALRLDSEIEETATALDAMFGSTDQPSTVNAVVPVGLPVWKRWAVKSAKNGRLFFSAEHTNGQKVNAPLPNKLKGACESALLGWSVCLVPAN